MVMPLKCQHNSIVQSNSYSVAVCQRQPCRLRSIAVIIILGLSIFSELPVTLSGDDRPEDDSDDYGATVEVEEEHTKGGELVFEAGDRTADRYDFWPTETNRGVSDEGDVPPPVLDKSMIQPRIVGGSAVSAEEYPYAVLLGHGDRIKCAGSLVAPDVVLTAGHCRGAESVFVQESDDSSARGSAFRPYIVRRERRHPRYDSEGLDFDVTVVQLKNAVDNVTPVSLDDGAVMEDVDEGEDLMVVGWGSDSESGEGKTQLHAAYVGYVEQSECKKRYSDFITDRMMCFGGGSRDACAGDSGGPLVKRDSGNGFDTQVGIVSWGVGCARRGYPGVYVRIHVIHEWILEVLDDWNVNLLSPIEQPSPSPPPARPPSLLPPASTLPPATPKTTTTGVVTSTPVSDPPGSDLTQTPNTEIITSPAPSRISTPSSTPAPVSNKELHPSQIVCPDDTWHIVEWQLHVPYNSAQWERSLLSAARASLVAKLNGLPSVSGFLRLKRMELDDDELRMWASSESTCSSPTLTASFWLHFTGEQYANIFKDWLRGADEWLLPPIFKAVPDLCGARMSTNKKLISKTYCVIPHPVDGTFSYEFENGGEFTSSTASSDDD